MDRAALAFLAGEAGAALLARLAAEDLSPGRSLALITALRREVPAEVASAALSLAQVRVRAASKFSRPDSLFFTREALEQASGERVATWRAARFGSAGFDRLADLGCGCGGDTLALAGIPGTMVMGVDRDALRLRMARLNLAVYGRTAALVQADLADPLPLRGTPAAFFDPARRSEGRRLFSVRDTIPPLDVIQDWDFEALAVKLAPGVDHDELRSYTRGGAGVEFVSLAGELKEAVLWTGALGFAGRWATCLAADGAGETLTPAGLDAPPLAEPCAYLYEPDPAVIRAGLLAEAAARLGVTLYRLDETIAYLTGDVWADSRWARVWPVWEWLPFNLKRLQALLRSRGIRQVTVKKRGSPLTPQALIRKLKLDGGHSPGDAESAEAVVVLTRVAGQHSAIVCGPMLSGGA